MRRMARLLTLVASAAMAATVALPGPALAQSDDAHPDCSNTATAATPVLLGASCFVNIDCPSWAWECDITTSGDVSAIGMVQGALAGTDGSSPSMCSGWFSCTLPTADRVMHGGTQLTLVCAANGVAVLETVRCGADVVYLVI